MDNINVQLGPWWTDFASRIYNVSKRTCDGLAFYARGEVVILQVALCSENLTTFTTRLHPMMTEGEGLDSNNPSCFGFGGHMFGPYEPWSTSVLCLHSPSAISL